MKLGRFMFFTRVTNGDNNRPRGLVWLTACFEYKNIQLIPVGYKR